ncbi:type II and III secretion system protein family protein [Sphingomonas sp. R1]|uniref:type II and III secretion system protein family protein n=1 Tax=Sphingomonas sp. R1 TaxID=399176 RepID=UPI0022254547|nr:type II and III secretion system protein family protein [Sphingomonas sp. R1]UYY78943.1 type II and III secretion system protein family protein [Sphingomonas sp. R1]
MQRTLLLGVGAVAALIACQPVPAQTRSAKPVARMAQLPAGSQRPTRDVVLSIGEGELVTLPAAAANVWTSNPGVADVYVASSRQIHLYGKAFGEATVFATNAAGAVVYSANVRVSQNISSIDAMMKAAMPDSDISVTTVGQIAVINGTVRSPQDSEQAQRLVTSLLNPGVKVDDASAPLKIGVVNRLRTATPLQVQLQVRFAEVSRSFVKNLNVNLTNRDHGSVLFGISQGKQGSITTWTGDTQDSASGAVKGDKVFTFPSPSTGSTLLGAAGHFLGTDLLASLDFGETIGQVSTLATPSLTALSGETANFLAGGEIPIPIAQALGTTTVEYKQYGVSLAFTPTVLADGRISLHVRPEVSQLSSSGAVTLANTTIPALTTRRSETTVELGSGESMVIGGLLQNTHNNSITKTPGLGDMPILGALFRSNGFQRNETELVIVITPYLVRPVNANQIRLPTDGYKAPNDFDRIFLGELAGGKSGGERPMPRMAPQGASTPPTDALAPAPVAPSRSGRKSRGAATPGFGL